MRLPRKSLLVAVTDIARHVREASELATREFGLLPMATRESPLSEPCSTCRMQCQAAGLTYAECSRLCECRNQIVSNI